MHIEHEAVSITKIRSQVKRLKHVGARRDTAGCLSANLISRWRPRFVQGYTPPAYLKVHTASYHFLGNGKIRRFGCSLLFSGVASVTHVGYGML